MSDFTDNIRIPESIGGVPEEAVLEGRPDPWITLDMPGWARYTFRASEIVEVSFVKEETVPAMIRVRLRGGRCIEFDTDDEQSLRHWFGVIEASATGGGRFTHFTACRCRFFAGNERTLDTREGEQG